MIREAIETAALAIEALAVIIILVAIVHGTARYLLHIQQQVDGAYERYKTQLARALLLGLEFLVAADIVRTVALEPTLHNVGILALLVLVRTFLSWSIVVEIEGHWPWRGSDGTTSRRLAAENVSPAAAARARLDSEV
jgi:uncharacterized membrane protein